VANLIPIALTGFFGLLASGFSVGLLRELRLEGRLARRGLVVQGWVVRRDDDGDGDGDTVPVVRFRTSTSETTHEFAAQGGTRRVRTLPLGTIVQVRYLPESPDVARIDTTSEVRAGTLGFGLALGISLSLGSLTLWWALSAK
jgi:hypothetical protein